MVKGEKDYNGKYKKGENTEKRNMKEIMSFRIYRLAIEIDGII